MVTVVFYDSDQNKYELAARAGDSLMEIAVISGVPGIDAICGGSCICGTCPVHVADDWLPRLAPRAEAEIELLENSPHNAPNSRLACQIRASDDLDGIVVRIPPSQS